MAWTCIGFANEFAQSHSCNGIYMGIEQMEGEGYEWSGLALQLTAPCSYYKTGDVIYLGSGDTNITQIATHAHLSAGKSYTVGFEEACAEPQPMKECATESYTHITQITPMGKNSEDFIPQGYTLFAKTEGDLTHDGIKDTILMLKATDPKGIILDDNQQKLDRNRRGIVILHKTKDGYLLASENDGCFSSENEDGGVYYPPELDIKIQNQKLVISYSHGRYGNWEYTFRYQDFDYVLIGYDASDAMGDQQTSINFLTHKRVDKTNTTPDANSPHFEEKWSTINQTGLLKLSEIKDFDTLSF
ncbi:MAG: hypothetical protein RLZZ428_438 [Pseudomonadota bacterium]